MLGRQLHKAENGMIGYRPLAVVHLFLRHQNH